MSKRNGYLEFAANPVVSIVTAVDQDVERGEDILMLGYSLVMMAPIFAPIAPPKVLLPLMALVFVISVCLARLNFYGIRQKLAQAMATAGPRDLSALRPIQVVLAEYPTHSLADAFNPLKNLIRTAKSTLGAMMINPFWMPIFYMLGLQFAEDKHFALLNKAVITVEQKLGIGNVRGS